MQSILLILFFFFIPINVLYADIHYPNVSKNKEVQALFDEGILNYYAYLYVQAEYDFRQALMQDPGCGLCYFGLAMAKKHQALELGEPFNKVGYDEIRKASSLIHPDDEFYYDLIQAARLSFSLNANDTSAQLQDHYIKALKALYDKYKNNKEWAEESLALYVDAIAYRANAGSKGHHCGHGMDSQLKAEAIALMTPILSDASYPDHPGLIHTYIHLTERDLTNPLGEILAKKLPTFSHDKIAHYTHMPNHIYWRRGMYEQAIQSNLDAIAIDKNYFKHKGVGLNSYYYEYHYLHSYHFLVALGILTNDFSLALENAKSIKNLMDVNRIDHLPDYRDTFLTLEHLVLLRFNQWDEVLSLETPAQTGSLGKLFIQFAKALAFLNKGEEQKFQQLFEQIKKEKYQPANLQDIQTLVLTYLEAAQMDRQKKSISEMENLFLKNHVKEIENKLFVMNPPLWFFPFHLFLSDKAFERGDLKAAKAHHDLFEKMYPNSTIGQFKKS